MFKCSLQTRVEQQVTQRFALLRSLFFSNTSLSLSVETVAFLSEYSLVQRLLYFGSILNYASAIHSDLCLVVSNAFAKSTVATHILTPTPDMSVLAICTLLDDPKFDTSAETLPGRLALRAQAWSKVCVTEALKTIFTMLVEHK